MVLCLYWKFAQPSVVEHNSTILLWRYVIEKQGTNPNEKDPKNRTALYWAIDQLRTNTLQFLLDENINLSSEDENGLTALDFALILKENAIQSKNNTALSVIDEIIKILKQRNATNGKCFLQNEQVVQHGSDAFIRAQKSEILSNQVSPSSSTHSLMFLTTQASASESNSNSNTSTFWKKAHSTQEKPSLPSSLEWAFVSLEGPCSEDEFIQAHSLLLSDRKFGMDAVLEILPLAEDEESIWPEFRFDPPQHLLKVMLCYPPNDNNTNTKFKHRCWMSGIRKKDSKELVGFVSAWNTTVRVHDRVIPMVEANSMIVHQELRSQGLASFLMMDLMKKCTSCGVVQAIHTSAYPLPQPPAAICTYYHRALDAQHLCSCSFITPKPFETTVDLILKYAVPQKNILSGVKPCTEKHLPQLLPLFEKYLAQFKLAPVFGSEEELARSILPKQEGQQVVYSYVVEDEEGNVTDFTSLYVLDGTAKVGHKTTFLKSGYCFYLIPSKHSEMDLMKETLILAKQIGCHVVTCLDNFHHAELFEGLGFVKDADNQIFYNLFNTKTEFLHPKDVGIVFW